MFDEIILYYSLFFITNFLLSFLILKLIVSNKIKFFNKIIIKKNSDYKMHSYKIYQNAGFIVIGLFLIVSTILYSWFYKDIKITENISRPIVFFISILILYIMSIYDFKKNLHPILRLIIQITLVYASLTLIQFPILSVEFLVPEEIGDVVVLSPLLSFLTKP